MWNFYSANFSTGAEVESEVFCALARKKLNDLKHKITTVAPARTRKKLLEVTTSHMKLIESSPDRMASYFGDPRVSYAACHNN